MLIATNTLPWNGLLAGAAIGGITLILLWVANRRLGISTGFEDLCALVSRRPYFLRHEIAGSRRWRLYFFIGLLAGGVLSSALSPAGWHTTWALGLFDARIGWGALGKSLWMLGGGLLIGFGTRLAGGCTSGHGIFGVANLERASFAAMFAFMASGLITTNLVYRVIAAGGG